MLVHTASHRRCGCGVGGGIGFLVEEGGRAVSVVVRLCRYDVADAVVQFQLMAHEVARDAPPPAL
jgi:hypothetical protein